MAGWSWMRWLPNGLTVTLLALLAANYFAPFGDLDYTWQLHNGEIIVRTGNLQPPDQFSYTIAGKELPDFEWLYDVTLWVIWQPLGHGGLKLLKVILVGSTLLLLGWRLRVGGMHWRGVALGISIAVVALAPAWNLRPMYCSTIGLLLVSGWLHDHCSGRKALTWWLPLVMLLWANLHPLVLFGQAMLCAAIAWEWLNAKWQINPPLARPALRRLTLVGGLGLAATLISTDPLWRLAYPFQPELAHPIQRAFVEMQPLYTLLTQPPYTSGLIFAVAGVVGCTVVLRFRQYRIWEIMLLLGLTAAANKMAREAMDWLLMMLALGLPQAAILLRDWALADRRRRGVALALRIDSCWKRLWNCALLRFQRGWMGAACGLLVVVSLIPPLARAMPNQDAEQWPSGALAHLKARGIGGNFFGPPDYGAYVTWKLEAAGKCYTDTRGFYFPPELLEDSIYVPQLHPGWEERMDRILNQYQTDYFILETTGARGELWRRLQAVGATDVVYLDEQTVVLTAETVRRGVKLISREDHPLEARAGR